jgi:hypothetical protein
MRKPCLHPGCPNQAKPGGSRCVDHAQQHDAGTARAGRNVYWIMRGVRERARHRGPSPNTLAEDDSDGNAYGMAGLWSASAHGVTARPLGRSTWGRPTLGLLPQPGGSSPLQKSGSGPRGGTGHFLGGRAEGRPSTHFPPSPSCFGKYLKVWTGKIIPKSVDRQPHTFEQGECKSNWRGGRVGGCEARSRKPPVARVRAPMKTI